MIFRIIYCSRSRIDGTKAQVAAEIASLLEVSRRNNAANDITGALFFNGTAFAQALEGSRSAVDAIYAKICDDTRHHDLLLLEDDHVVERAFLNWTMAYLDGHTTKSGFDTLTFDPCYLNPGTCAEDILTLLKTAVDARS